MVALLHVLSPQAQQREGNSTIVTHLPVELQRLPVQLDGVVEISAIKRERACLTQELSPRGRVGAVALAQGRLQPRTPLQKARPQLPKACQRCGQPEGRLWLTLERPSEGRPHVVVLGFQALQARQLVLPAKVRPGCFSQPLEMLGVQPPYLLGLAARFEPFASV